MNDYVLYFLILITILLIIIIGYLGTILYRIEKYFDRFNILITDIHFFVEKYFHEHRG
jgi:hypothetical protein